ncbi:hypothetical protein G4926_13200 [Anaerostipes hadrus]|nr:hypothetical protein [Anaerostipes hadrus]NSG77442.1 hypothetical protein [Anaerostipes hadrus]
MMEEGVNMIKELIKIKENNNIVSIFCDEDDTSMFLEGLNCKTKFQSI